MIYTIDEIRAMLASYTAAEKALLAGKTVSFNGRTMTRENLSEIRAGRKEWESRLSRTISKRSSRQPSLSSFS
jgi:hypothetical protein